MEIFEKYGIQFVLRWWHVIFGIAWIGLLYFFNFVQMPSYAEMEAAHRNGAITKLTKRALDWFRWASLATFLTGILIWGAADDAGDFIKGPHGHAILTGMLLAMVMLTNVWMFIYPNQKIVIANAQNLLNGGQPDPAAAGAGRRATLASRTNTFFSITMLSFMVGASHFYGIGAFSTASTGKLWVYWIITLVVVAIVEANALGVIRGFDGPGTKLIDNPDTGRRNVIIGGVVMAIVWYLLWEILLGA